MIKSLLSRGFVHIDQFHHEHHIPFSVDDIGLPKMWAEFGILEGRVGSEERMLCLVVERWGEEGRNEREERKGRRGLHWRIGIESVEGNDSHRCLPDWPLCLTFHGAHLERLLCSCIRHYHCPSHYFISVSFQQLCLIFSTSGSPRTNYSTLRHNPSPFTHLCNIVKRYISVR